MDGGIAAGRQKVDRRVARLVERLDRGVVGHEHRVVSGHEGKDVLRRPPRVAEPVDPGGTTALAQRRDHRGIHLVPLEHQHDGRRRAGDRAGQAVVQANSAEPAEPPAGPDQVDRGHPTAQPLQRAAAQAGVGVERLVERAHQEHASIGEPNGHETKVAKR
jgi:hypothetical protein